MKKKKIEGEQRHWSSPPLLDSTEIPREDVAPTCGNANPSGHCMLVPMSGGMMYDEKIHSNGVSHVPKADSTSADRVRACTVAGRVQYKNGCKTSQKSSRKKKNKKKKKQNVKLLYLSYCHL